MNRTYTLTCAIEMAVFLSNIGSIGEQHRQYAFRLLGTCHFIVYVGIGLTEKTLEKGKEKVVNRNVTQKATMSSGSRVTIVTRRRLCRPSSSYLSSYASFYSRHQSWTNRLLKADFEHLRHCQLCCL